MKKGIDIQKFEQKANEIIENVGKQETLEEELLLQIKFCLECKNESQAIRLIEKYGFVKQEERYSEEEVRNLLIECCGEVSCEDGALVGKDPADLAEWIDRKFKNK